MNYREKMDKSFDQLLDNNAVPRQAGDSDEAWQRGRETAKNLFSCGMSAMHKLMAEALKDSDSLEQYILACNEIAVDILRFSDRFSEQEISELVELHTKQKLERSAERLKEVIKQVVTDIKDKLEANHAEKQPPKGSCPNSKE